MLGLRARQSPRSCPLCRDALEEGEEVEACPGCETRYHFECLRDLGGCATLGCPEQGHARRRGVRVEVGPAPIRVGSGEELRARLAAERCACGKALEVLSDGGRLLGDERLHVVELRCTSCAAPRELRFLSPRDEVLDSPVAREAWRPPALSELELEFLGAVGVGWGLLASAAIAAYVRPAAGALCALAVLALGLALSARLRAR
ncbi:MAG: RING finger protein [Planctomycetota bacterium]